MFVQDGFLYLIVTRHKLTVYLSIYPPTSYEYLKTPFNKRQKEKETGAKEECSPSARIPMNFEKNA
jgi:hypothetical protein